MKALQFSTVAVVIFWAVFIPHAASAQEETRPPITRQGFKLDPETGCFRYTGKAVEFVGRLKAGAFIHVDMNTLDASGQPVPAADEMRIPIMEAPELKTIAPGYWFGPLPKSGSYTIGFMPQAAFGHPGKVLICGHMSPPERGGLYPEEAEKLDKIVQDAMENDPYSQALLKEPKTLAVQPGDDIGEQADVCGFPIRDVTIRAGEDTDASPLQPRVAGSVKHYANLYGSPFEVFAVCTPVDVTQPIKTVKLSENTKDCYFAGGRLECSFLANNEIVPAE